MLLLASVALGAAGAYQSTKDGKTTVWNSKPRPGEAADWSGKRDRDGYATGFGTLTWFNAKGTVYARYYGNVVRGKLNGPVNVHSKGKTGHAYFVDGERSTPWATGPAPLRMVAPEETEPTKIQEVATAKPETPEAEPQAPAEKASKTKTSEPSLLAPGEVRPIEHVARKSETIQQKTSKRSKSAKAENSPSADARHGEQAATSSGASTNTETSPPIEPTPIAAATAPEVTPKSFASEPAETPRVQETPQGQRSEVRDQTAEGSNSIESAATPAAPNATASKEVDNSLKSLVAPPSSLRSTPAPSPSETPE
jgi:hypothetical protein